MCYAENRCSASPPQPISVTILSTARGLPSCCCRSGVADGGEHHVRLQDADLPASPVLLEERKGTLLGLRRRRGRHQHRLTALPLPLHGLCATHSKGDVSCRSRQRVLMMRTHHDSLPEASKKWAKNARCRRYVSYKRRFGRGCVEADVSADGQNRAAWISQGNDPSNKSRVLLSHASVYQRAVRPCKGAPFARYASPASDATAITLRSVTCRPRPPRSAGTGCAASGAGSTSAAAGFGGSCTGRDVSTDLVRHSTGHRLHARPRCIA